MIIIFNPSIRIYKMITIIQPILFMLCCEYDTVFFTSNLTHHLGQNFGNCWSLFTTDLKKTIQLHAVRIMWNKGSEKEGCCDLLPDCFGFIG